MIASHFNIAMARDLRIEAALHDRGGRVFGVVKRQRMDPMHGLTYTMVDDDDDSRDVPLSSVAWIRRAPREP